jgi:type IV secretory pathway TraG/TraD family ATPase VirD4
MSSSTSRRASGPPMSADALLLAALMGVVGAAAVAFSLGVRIAAVLTHDHGRFPGNPVTLATRATKGEVVFPAGWIVYSLAIALTLLSLSAAAWWAGWRSHRREDIDRAAGWMAHGKDQLGRLHHQAATKTAIRLGQQQPGLSLGCTVSGGDSVFMGWEDVATLIMGPRAGKTTSIGIPLGIDAPGAVVFTSNKRDLVDATRGPRAERGSVMVFDPQGIAEEPSGQWWWNPLSYVTNEVKAKELADIFALASTSPEDKGDKFFDGAGNKLLSYLLLAAARDGRKLTQVREWLTQPGNLEPAVLLRQHGYALLSKSAIASITAPDRQRGGVYETAAGFCEFMENRQAMNWAEQPDDPTVPQFNPAAFVRSNGTLYSLSREGRSGAAPLVTALTAAVCDAAEQLAKSSPYGRLEVPLVMVLDEAANVCRWRKLPDLYSHYGSRGILPLTILQSYAQGEEVWGKGGMRKLWSASTIRVVGAGVIDVEFLDGLSKVIGDFDHLTWSESHSRNQGRNISRQVRRERILDIADLAALPLGRMIVIASGSRPALVRSIPWMNRDYATAIRASLKQFEPAANRADRQPGEVSYLILQSKRATL